MKFVHLLITISVSKFLFAQEPHFVPVRNVPALEVYDLLKDRNGYIWLGHDFGVSRYDGINFIDFNHPDQNALSMTDLFEDNEGRIWCHNFEGQIFYIENFNLHLLRAYHFTEEHSYPRIGICKDELIATSSKGLFTCNTKTFASKYIPIEGGTSALCVLNDGVLLYGNGRWHYYQPGIGLKNLSPLNFTIDRTEGLSIGASGAKDTAILILNPEGIYHKLLVKGDKLISLKKNEAGGFINTVAVDDKDIWINTKFRSYCDGKTDTIKNVNITDVVKDNDGDIFYSNLKDGLVVQYSGPLALKIDCPFLGPADYIKKIVPIESGFVCGTQKGSVFVLSTNFTRVSEFRLPGNEAPVEHLYKINENQFVIGSSVGVFSLDISQNKLTQIENSLILKDAVVMNNDVVLGTTRGIFKTTIDGLKRNTAQLTALAKSKTGRTRSLQYNKDGSVMLCSFSDGVYEFKNDSFKPLLFNGQRIYSSVIRYLDNKFIIGTFSQGMFILDNDRISNLTTADGLIANSIRNVKIYNDHAWIIFNGFIQKLNRQMKLVQAPEIPFKGSLIYDLAEHKQNIFIVTGDGIYEVGEPQNKTITDSTRVDFVIVNGKDTAINNVNFSHSMNNLQIVLSTPYYRPFNLLRYKYRFYKDADTSWRISEDNQKVFNLIALGPGQYLFEAVAINGAGEPVAAPLKYSIRISPAWYQTFVFRILASLLIAIFIGLILWFYYRSRLRKEKAKYEKMLTIQQERQRISSEMHDDIGAGLSGVKLLTELTRNKMRDPDAVDDIEKIHKSVGEISAKMKEVIWSLNTENDNLSNLISYIQKQVRTSLEHYPCQLIIDIPDEIPDKIIDGETRRNIFLIVKEAINNIIKHSGADKVHIKIIVATHLIISIADNGKSMSKEQENNGGNGMRNIRKRVRQLKGNLFIENEQGLNLIVEIPI